MDPGTATDAAARTTPAGSSAFLAGFDPATVLRGVPLGRECRVETPREKVVPRTRRDGPRLTLQRSWIAWCPIAVGDRQAYLVRLFGELARVAPADTYGYSADGSDGGDALLPYAEPHLAGTVSVVAGSAAKGLAVAIVVEEWSVSTAR